MLALRNSFQIASKCFNLIPKVAGQRNNFGPSFYGMDKFNRHLEYISNKHRNDLDSIRGTIQRCVEKPESKAFTEDIKTFLYVTKTDADFQLLIKAISKYETQESSPMFNFRFGAPLMRLAHTLNKTNEMLELYLKEEQNYLHTTVMPGFILMNKLFDEKRFEDVLRVFFRLKESLKSREGELNFPQDPLKLAIEANLELNDEQSISNAVKLFEIVKENKTNNVTKMISCLFLTAVQKENHELAYEFYSFLETRQNRSMVNKNLQIIALCLLGKTGEALNAFKTDNKKNNQNDNPVFYFKTTLDTLKETVNRTKNEEYKRLLDEILSKIKSESLVARSDIKEYATRIIYYTFAEREKMRNERQNNSEGTDNNSFKQRNRFNNRNENNSYNRDRSFRETNQEERFEEQENPNERRNYERLDSNKNTNNSSKSRKQYLE